MNGSAWLPIEYREFYDVPRLLTVADDMGRVFMLDCPFNDEKDDYEDFYRVLLVRDDDLPRLPESDWRPVLERSRYVGVIPISRVVFDPTRRSSVQSQLLGVITELPQG